MVVEKIFVTRGFIMNFWSGIFIALNVSLALMFLFLLIGLGPILTTIAFIGSLILIILGLSGKTIYKVDTTGISQTIIPSKISSIYKKPIEREFSWSEIKTASAGWDLTRVGTRFEYLHLSVSKNPGSLRISDDKGTQSFLDFRSEVMRKINAFNKHVVLQDSLLQNNPTIKSFDSITRLMKPISIRRSFYDKPIAKVVTVLFILLTLGILIYFTFFGVRGSNLFRLEYILIPGTGYLYWRVFKNKN